MIQLKGLKELQEAFEGLAASLKTVGTHIRKHFEAAADSMRKIRLNQDLCNAKARKLAYLRSEVRRRGFVSPKLAKRIRKWEGK